ncbi:protein neprosin-like [Humulus lupulus]|uniref:protein neprosin-like n=1 Tax=Humulus lupulus TaxID=3486 RepID=UPI002B403DA3|nr:protein neprosin-like [Humulus lupulus]
MVGGPYFGAKARINVWNPDPHGTISISQIWVVSSHKNYDQLNSVEAGWISDGYRSTGCYNHDCPGFVQHKESGQWWVQYQNEPIGYWPNSIFTTLKNGADLLSWGGEIVNNGINHHTETQMGSGHFPAEGFGRASFFSNIEYIDSSRLLRDPNKFITYATKPSCYDVKVAIDNSALGAHFFYGGPGYSDKCRI